MKKALVLVPLGAAAVGAAVFFAMKKPAGEKAAPAKKAAPGGKKKLNWDSITSTSFVHSDAC